MAKLKLLVCCGNGAGTSMMIKLMLKKWLKRWDLMYKKFIIVQ